MPLPISEVGMVVKDRKQCAFRVVDEGWLWNKSNA